MNNLLNYKVRTLFLPLQIKEERKEKIKIKKKRKRRAVVVFGLEPLMDILFLPRDRVRMMFAEDDTFLVDEETNVWLKNDAEWKEFGQPLRELFPVYHLRKPKGETTFFKLNKKVKEKDKFYYSVCYIEILEKYFEFKKENK